MRIVLAISFTILSATFAFADDRIWLENTMIDGKAVRMVFDSGSSSVDLTLQAVKRLGLKVVVPPTNGTGDTAVYSAEFDGQPFKTDFGILNIPAGWLPDFDGLMGWNSLSRGIWRIDAETEKLTPLSEIPAGIRPWMKALIDTNSDVLNLVVQSKEGGHNIIFVDTGIPGGIQLPTGEWRRWKKSHPRNPITLRAIATADGIYACEESWANQIQIGPLNFNDVPVMEEIPSTAIELGGERDVLGFAALRRLDLVVDGIHGVAYLRVKQTPPQPYSYNRLGATFIPTATDAKDLIAQVVTGSPAYDAGIRNGDILLKIDGRSVGNWTNGWKETEFFLMPVGTKLQLTLQRDKKILETMAVLRKILQPSHRKYKSPDDFPGKSELDAETYYSQAMECEIRSDSNGALTNYDKAIEINPDLGDAYSRRGYLEQSNNPNAALADYSKAINLGAGTAEDYGDRGMVEQSRGDSTAALADYCMAIKMEPGWAEVYTYRGSLEQQTNDFDAAIADYEKALQLKVAFPGVKSALAVMYEYRGDREMRTDRFEAALADCNKAIEFEPDLAEAYVDRGWLEEQTNRLDAAIGDYDKALQLKPGLADTKSHLAQIYGYRGDREMRTKQADAALADFNRVIALEPGLAQAYVDRGWLEQQKGYLNAALADDTEAINLAPGFAGTYSNRGYLERVMGKIDAALADDDRAIQLEPGTAELYGNRSGVEEIKGDLDRSEADCAKAIKLDPQMAATAAQEFHNLGYDRYQRLEFTNALSDFRETCGLDPTNDYAHFGIWLCSSSLGNSDGANKELKAYLIARSTKDSGDWPSEVGRFLVGQVTEQDLLSAAKSADTKKDKEQHCEAYYYIGARHLIAGNKTVAAAEFRKCVATGVQNWVEYGIAKAELQVLQTN